MEKFSYFCLICLFLMISVSLKSEQLNEGFEDNILPPVGWSIEYANPNHPLGNSMTIQNVGYSGSHSFRFSSYYQGSPFDQYLISPMLDTSEGDQTISFWYKNSALYPELFNVGWSLDGDDISSDFTWSNEVISNSTSWSQFIKNDLPVGTKYIAIHYYSQ